MTAPLPQQRKIVPVIISGGSGTRLWPLSSEGAPKQFHGLGGRLTMIQETARRFGGDGDPTFEAPVIICNRRHRELVRRQLSEIGVEPSALVLEPSGRNTAAAAVLAARLVLEIRPGALALLAPADHVIADERAFRSAIARAAQADDWILTFGVRPTGPETGYGYIQRGEAVGDGVFKVARFVEKPLREAAYDYVRAGDYYWNAGIFLFDPALMLSEVAAHRPDILAAVDAAWAQREVQGDDSIELPEALFNDAPTESIDIAVMEKTRRAAVAPFDAGWADLGSWSEVWRLSEKDAAGNVLVGEALALDSCGALVWSEGVLVATIGVQDMIVVATREATLVAPRSRAQDVKMIVEMVQNVAIKLKNA
jgi:mannose-1-phosphate guanylyltransferase/mannose-6-phosphate isomerase